MLAARIMLESLTLGLEIHRRIRQCRIIYKLYTYTPNLGLAIAVFDQEREQGRFEGSIEGAMGEQA